MKTCPHCHTPIPKDDDACPECGAEYWEPGGAAAAGPGPPHPEDQGEGCASVLVVPLLTSLLVTASLILAGFVWNVLAHFESLYFRLLWLAGSCLAGIVCYRLIRFFRHKRNGNFPN